jgi:hypothetical protein
MRTPPLPGHNRNLAQGSIRQAVNEIWRDGGLRAVMAMSSLYESALYVFVFVWTPALEVSAQLQ